MSKLPTYSRYSIFSSSWQLCECGHFVEIICASFYIYAILMNFFTAELEALFKGEKWYAGFHKHLVN